MPRLRGVRTALSEKPKPEPTESIEIFLAPISDAIEMARTGGMKTGPSALAVLFAEPRLRALGIA